MSDDLAKVSSGDPLRIPAKVWNLVIDAVRAHLSQAGPSGGSGGFASSDSGVVMVRNDSGADRDAFNVLGIDDVEFDPATDLESFQYYPILSGITPTVADHAGRFVVLLDPVAAGEIGRAVASGVVPVQVDVVAESDTFADVKDGDVASLASGATGSATILWKPAGTGLKWCIVRLGGGAIAGDGLPPGGTTGQALEKLSNADGDAGWVSLPPGLPAGGGTYYVLQKVSATNYDVVWGPVHFLDVAP